MNFARTAFQLLSMSLSVLSASGGPQAWTDIAANRTIEGEFLRAEENTFSSKAESAESIAESIDAPALITHPVFAKAIAVPETVMFERLFCIA